MIRRLLRGGVTALAPAVVLLALAASAWADSIYVPDADFNTIYKPGYTPGSTSVVSATYINGFANFAGSSSARLAGWLNQDGSVAYSATVDWSDGTVSSGNGGVNPDYVVLPGWTGIGAVQQSGVDGSISLAQNGNERMHSSASLGTIAANTSYTLSAYARGISFAPHDESYRNPLYLNLLADDVAVTDNPSKITTTGDMVNYSVTFTAAQLQSFVGKSLKVEVGGFANYDQVQIDNVALTYTYQPVPEPTTLVSLLSCACTVGLFLGLRQRIRR